MFDVRSLIIFLITATIILLIEMIFLARIFPRQKYIRVWVICYLTLLIAQLGLVLRGVIPDLISIVFANIFIALTYIGNIWAAEILIERKRYHIGRYATAMVLFSLLILYWGEITPSYYSRLFVTSFMYGGLSLIFGYIMVTRGSVKYKSCKWIGYLMIVNAAVLFIRVIAIFDSPGMDTLLSPSNLNIYSLWKSNILVVLFGCLTVKLALEVDTAEHRSTISAD